MLKHCPHKNRPDKPESKSGLFVSPTRTKLKCPSKPSCGYLIDPTKATKKQRELVGQTIKTDFKIGVK